MNRDEMIQLLHKHLHNDKLIKHVYAVEAIMKKLAERLGEDRETWGMVGLLHDLDYEYTMNDMKNHGLKSAELLKNILPEEALEAIRAHNELTGYVSTSKLTKALKAADQVSGLIVATALVMPNKSLSEVRIKSIKKKFKQKDFARGVSREKIRLIEELGLSLDEFFELSLKALQEIKDKLGL